MNWFKKHADTIATISVLLGGVTWMNIKFNSFEKEIHKMDRSIDARFVEIEKDIAIIKTVLVMKDVLPRELAVREE